jgi:hypothetical protein
MADNDRPNDASFPVTASIRTLTQPSVYELDQITAVVLIVR